MHVPSLTRSSLLDWVLLKPTAKGPWFKFDDDRVTRVTERDVLEENYGGEMHLPDGQVARMPGQLGKPGAKRFTNAYMLVYVRQSQSEELLKEVTDADTPDHLRQFLISVTLFQKVLDAEFDVASRHSSRQRTERGRAEATRAR